MCIAGYFLNFSFNVFFFAQILSPVSALLVIDVQNDFIDGTLAIRHCPAGQEGAEVVPVINELLDTVPFNLVIYSLDWHPPNHISFIENKNDREIHKTSKVWAHLFIIEVACLRTDSPLLFC